MSVSFFVFFHNTEKVAQGIYNPHTYQFLDADLRLHNPQGPKDETGNYHVGIVFPVHLRILYESS